MPTQQDQVRREQDDVAKAVAQYKEFLETAPPADTPPGRKLVARSLKKLIPVVQKAQRQFRQKRSTPETLPLLINTLSAEKMAVLAIRSILVRDLQRRNRGLRLITNQAHNLGRHIRYEYELEVMRKEDRDLFRMMTSRTNQLTRKSTASWRKRCEAIRDRQWGHEEQIRLGIHLLGLLVQACPEDFTEVQFQRKNRTYLMVGMTPQAEAALDIYNNELPINRLSAMIYPPQDWSDTQLGGYYTTEQPLVKNSPSSDTGVHDVPAQVMLAINTLQSVPWAINQGVLEVARKSYEAKTPIGYLREGLIDLPTRVPDAEWAALETDERRAIKSDLVTIHNHNNRLSSRLAIMRRQLALSADYSQHEQIWFPYEIDFRGRVYPVSMDLHPQANDLGRALLRFGEAKSLGDEGLYWLCIHIANCYGEDKASLSERFEWTRSRLDDLDWFAQDPLDYLEFWQGADKPWQFLAGCFELREAMAHPTSPRDYLTTLPIDLDGTCNGLQHLSSLGHDTQAAAAVNMLPGPRQDIYQVVADMVAQRVPEDSPWHGNVSRAVVKRAVMTTPYGVTDIGIRDQLLDDRFVSELGIERKDYIGAANEMRDWIKAAIDETLDKPRRIMRWFHQVSEIFTEVNEPLDWTTPTGFKVSQAYRQPVMRRIRTLAGDGLVRRTHVRVGSKREIQKRKQLNAAAPNIIHSFDASHLIRTVLAFTSEVPGAAFAPVHDSFGTHACDVPVLSRMIREEFVRMYRSNWLLALHYEWKLRADALGIGIPPAPEQGDLDIEKVLDSTYFFS
ncbi:MAG: hypothetical protein GY906_23080 [bacterium]|nr:hypothetical protein [bacterium]